MAVYTREFAQSQEFPLLMRHQILLLTVIRITEDAVSKTNATKRYLYFENSDFNVSTSSTNSPTSHLSNRSGGKSAKIKGLGLLRTSCMSSYFVFLEPIPLTVVVLGAKRSQKRKFALVSRYQCRFFFSSPVVELL